MKLTFSHTRLRALWAEAIRQWPMSVRSFHGHTSPGFWIVGGEGIYLMHNGARPRGHATLAYANECDPGKLPFNEWSQVKRLVFGAGGGMEFVEVVMIGTAVDAGCDIEVTFEQDTMTVSLLEDGKASLRWQSSRTRLVRDRYQ